jgi:hypothetical protein
VKAKTTTFKKGHDLMKFTAELRYFNEDKTADMVHLVFEGRTEQSAFGKAFRHHKANYWQLAPAKINVLTGEVIIKSEIVKPAKAAGRRWEI